jgi:hypothetical protein
MISAVMSGSPPAKAANSDEELAKLLSLIEGADSVELKLTIPDENRRSTIAALGLDPLEAHLRQIFFFDTPKLDLNQAGVVVRARRSQGRPDDSVIKLRPVAPAELPEELRAHKQFGVEVDAMPGGFVCSASFKGETSGVREAVAGELPLSKLFSKAQRAFYSQQAPDDLAIDDLSVMGPVTVLKLKTSPEGYERKLVGELWFYPDGSRILELSTKCGPGEAFDIAARTRVYLAERGVNLGGEQETKTRAALDFFAAELAGS